MVRFIRTTSMLGMFGVLAGVGMVSHTAGAQESGNGFLFGAPAGSFTLRGGWALARAGSDLFSFATNQLTLNRRDFSSPELGGDLAFRIRSTTELVVSSSISGMGKRSEFRAFIDNNDQPIEQQTTFRRIPVTVGVKQYLSPTGRSIGNFAWVPERFAPYVGAGAGMMYYQFRQEGDFIDFQTTKVFHDLYDSDGWTKMADLNAGLDVSLGPRFALTTDARYVWSSAPLSLDFSGFHRLDLSGLSTTVGLAVRF
jgi:outer membrane protein W